MRRITLWLASTATIIVLLFSYHTSTSSAARTSISSPLLTGAGAAGSDTASNGSNGSGSSGATGSGSSSDSTGTVAGSSGSASTGSSGSASPGSTAASGSTKTSAPRTYTGDAVGTRYGDVQVQITVAAGKVTAAGVTRVPWGDRRDQAINSQAVPILNQEAVSAQSSQIDMVSGATFTSDGYIQSLQSALDQAGL